MKATGEIVEVREIKTKYGKTMTLIKLSDGQTYSIFGKSTALEGQHVDIYFDQRGEYKNIQRNGIRAVGEDYAPQEDLPQAREETNPEAGQKLPPAQVQIVRMNALTQAREIYLALFATLKQPEQDAITCDMIEKRILEMAERLQAWVLA